MTTFAADWLTPPAVLLEDRIGGGGGVVYARPHDIVRCDRASELDAAFQSVERGLANGLHAAGVFSYELGYALEPRLSPLMPRRRRAPLLWLGLFEPPARIPAADLDEVFASLGPPAPITGLRAASSRKRHASDIERALRLIEAGDIYQVNLTFPFRFRYHGDPLQLYAALRARQPVAHGGVAALGELTALSVSPELWLDIEAGRATTRPMKGTCGREAEPEADLTARAGLAADPKQRAENLMIVDLLRNDLARICVPGSVRVPALFTVETYPDFHTLTSTVVGQLAPKSGLRDRIAALFPCGSIVGAPKIRAGEIIRALEPSSRGVYTGALGAIAPSGDMRFNVAIRTAVLKADGEGRYGVGGGIVADSAPDAEYEEALLKARVLTDLAEDYGLIETLRWSSGQGFVRLERHLERLTSSAAALGFAFDLSPALHALTQLGDQLRGEPDQRVRLELARGGELGFTRQAVASAIERPLRVGVASLRLDAGDPFLRHKTTRRAAFDRAFAEAASAGLDESLLLNQHDVVADASRHSVFARRGDRLITPRLASGALPGVLRAALLAAGWAVEGTITLEDLAAADGWYLGNSLNGLRPADLV